MRSIVLGVLVLLGGSCPLEDEPPGGTIEVGDATVTRVVDGDTLWLDDGEKVRLIGIDAPEVPHPDSPGECYAGPSTDALTDLTLGRRVRVETDAELRDRFDRLLAYLWRGETMVNEAMVERGAALAKRYPPNLRYASRLEDAEERARDAGRGLWGAC